MAARIRGDQQKVGVNGKQVERDGLLDAYGVVGTIDTERGDGNLVYIPHGIIGRPIRI